MNIKKNSLNFLLIITLVFGVITFANNFRTVKAQNSIDLNEGIVPLKTVMCGNGYEDLKPLKTILKDKKIIAVGEATHGSKEFFQMKHRMFEFLVENLDCRLFGIEASFGQCKEINNYILYGKGNVKDVVNKMGFWTWSTKEVEDMVKWMRKYNKDPKHKTKIKFYGFDMQSCNDDKKYVLQYINKVDDTSYKNYNLILNKFNDNNIINMKCKDLKNIQNDAKSLYDKFTKNKNKYILKSSKQEYELIKQHLNIVNEFLDLIVGSKKSKMSYSKIRDFYMANNVKWILDYEKQFGNDKIMLWAHNAHVSKKFPMFTCMGQNLKNIFKDDLYVIGQEFYKGGFRAVPYSIFPVEIPNRKRLKNFTISASDKNTFAYKLNEFNKPMLFMDFKKASSNERIKEYINKPQIIHEIGAVYSPIFSKMSNAIQTPNQAFDGIIFIKETTPSVGI